MTAPVRAWGLRHSPDRVVVLGVLGLRCLPYIVEGKTGIRSIARLSISCPRIEEGPLYHAQTGIYGWLNIPQGEYDLQIRDTSGFYLDRRLHITAPDRSGYGARLLAGMESPPPSPPTVLDVPMRPSISHPWTSGLTMLHGIIRSTGGAPLPFARLELETVLGNEQAVLTTHADSKGEYAAHLAGEAIQFHLPDTANGEDENDAVFVTDFGRKARLYRLKAGQAALAASPDPLRALPLDFDTLDPAAADSPYETPAGVVARTVTGEIIGAQNSVNVPFTAGQIRRIDFILS